MIAILYKLFTQGLYLILYPYTSLRARSGDVKWKDRLGRGFVDPRNHPDDTVIWAHAASVGEVRALAILIHRYMHNRAKTVAVITVMTDKGYATARSEFSDLVERGLAVIHFAPVDVRICLDRALNATSPQIVIFTETELWPRWLKRLRQLEIPHILINARVSEKSFTRYRYVRSVMQRLLRGFDAILCQGPVFVERFEELGAGRGIIRITGNIKFEAQPEVITNEQRLALRTELGATASNFVFVCGSIREGEEGIIASALYKIKRMIPGMKFAVAPRHERDTEQLLTALRAAGLTVTRLSAHKQGQYDCVLIDVFGRLKQFYAAADIALVGGSFVPVGGHNLLEPILAGAPVLYGPFTGNVTDMVDLIERNKLGARVNSVDEIVSAVVATQRGERSFTKWVDAFPNNEIVDGPVSRTIAEIEYILEKPPGFLKM